MGLSEKLLSLPHWGTACCSNNGCGQVSDTGVHGKVAWVTSLSSGPPWGRVISHSHDEYPPPSRFPQNWMWGSSPQEEEERRGCPPQAPGMASSTEEGPGPFLTPRLARRTT